jgi:imidazolonepropionase-like amidohydrolase
MGTDAGGYGYGDNGLELALMVEAGMTPAQAIEASTRRSAECLGIADEVGTLTRGQAADLIVLDADPLADIAVVREAKHRALVLKAGVPVVGPLAAALRAAAS